jgi:hypothetical protein
MSKEQGRKVAILTSEQQPGPLLLLVHHGPGGGANSSSHGDRDLAAGCLNNIGRCRRHEIQPCPYPMTATTEVVSAPRSRATHPYPPEKAQADGVDLRRPAADQWRHITRGTVAADADVRELADAGWREPASGHRVEAMPWMREWRRFL